jgi:hypothetical protein
METYNKIILVVTLMMNVITFTLGTIVGLYFL